MGQFTHNGVIYEDLGNGKARVVGYANNPAIGPAIGGNPMVPGQLAGQSLSNTGKGIENQKNSATLPYDIRKAKADAQTAEINAKNATDQYNAQHPPVSTSGVYGQDYLKTLSPADQATVRALDEGRLAFPMNAGMRSPFWQEKLSQVAQYDPNFDATNFNARAKGRAAAISGKLGSSNNALNTAMGHLGTLEGQIGGTYSGNFTPFNAIGNTVSKAFGSPGVTNFEDTASKLADELEAVYRNGGGAEAGVVRQLRNLDVNASQAQKEGIIANAMDLLASKQAANLAQYNFGTGGKPTWDMLDQHTQDVLNQPQFRSIRDKYFAAPAVAAAASSGGNGGGGQGGSPDFSGMVGPPQIGPAGGGSRNVPDSATASGLSALIKQGRPYAEAAAYAQSNGYPPPDPQAYAAAVQFAHQHGGATNVEVNRSVPTTAFQRFAASPVAAGIAASAAGSAAGLSDVVGRTLAGPQYDANRHIMAAANPGADLAGNVVGGVLGTLGAGAAAGRLAPGLMDAARASRVAPFLPAAGDAAYGATYGASENPDNPLGGALAGAGVGIGGGMFARGAGKALARTIAPTGGAAAPLYAAGVTPTIGQRAAASGGIVGKAINGVEQAMQSFPGLGALPAMARQGARNQFQKGAFNDALSDINQQLPKGVSPGPEAHAFTAGQFTKAYDAARSGMQFVPDGQFIHDSAGFVRNLDNGTLNAEQADQVANVIGNAVDSRLKASGGALGGEAYKNAASQLAETQRKWAGSDPLKADALGEYMSIFDSAAKRNSDPQSVAMLDQADRGYAKFVRIQRASEMGGAQKDAGTFTPANYAGAVKQMGGGLRSNGYSQGNALGQAYADAGKKALSDTLADSGTPLRLGVLGGLQGAEGLGLAASGHLGVLTNPATLGMFAPYVGNVGGKMIAPNAQRLAMLPGVANALDTVGNGLYDRSGAIGRIGAPFALGYYGQQ